MEPNPAEEEVTDKLEILTVVAVMQTLVLAMVAENHAGKASIAQSGVVAFLEATLKAMVVANKYVTHKKLR